MTNNTHVRQKLSTVPALFRSVARQRSQAVALVWRANQLKYGMLDKITDQFGNLLLHAGVCPGSTIPFIADRCVDSLVAMLGILKAGCSYLPLDPMKPIGLLNRELAEISSPLVVSTSSRSEKLLGQIPHQILAVPSSDATGTYQDPVPCVEIQPSDAAYAMFTSGTSGPSRAAVIQHNSIVNLVANADYALLGPDAVLLQLAPLSFDASTFEVWGALLTGARLVIYPEADLSLRTLEQVLATEQVTTLWLTAGLFATIVRKALHLLRPLKCLLTGGDVVPSAAAAAFLREYPDCRLVNCYGPTECTTFACCYRVTKNDRSDQPLPIGVPIANTSIYILKDMRLLPNGVDGELCIAGDGVAKGYLSDPVRTRTRFQDVKVSDSTSERIFRTGDRARIGAHGRVEFLGRLDREVKVRGYRIDPTSIESAATEHHRVSEAHLKVRGSSCEERHLALYYAPPPPVGPSETELRDFLRERLPGYVIPAMIFAIDEFPLTRNGKVDYTAIPPPSPIEIAHAVPRSPMESQVASIWSRVLHQQDIALNDDFFHLGGDSLTAVCILAELENETGVALPVCTLYKNPTIASLAEKVFRGDLEGLQSIISIQETGDRRPFFCVHGLNGDPFTFFPLARHLPGRPLYGFRAFHGASFQNESISEMAVRYVEAMRSVQPSGPYLLGGYSGGGCVALEMCHQLQAQGTRAALLVVIDAEAPHELVANMAGMVNERAASEPEHQIRHEQSPTASSEAPTRYANLRTSFMTGFLRALLEYAPDAHTYSGPVVAIRANGPTTPSGTGSTTGWRSWTKLIRVLEFPGEHSALLKEPIVSSVGSALGTILDEIDLSLSNQHPR
jgi:amino acid adenylation domain-containing protein